MTSIARESFPLRGATTTSSPSYALPVINEVSSQYNSVVWTAGLDFIIPAGAAGTIVKIQLPYGQILGNYGRVGTFNDSSFAFGGLATGTFDVQIQFVPNENQTGGDATNINNGEFFIDYETGTVYGKKKNTNVTGTISASFWLPPTADLPIGAATEANQDISNASLSSINTKMDYGLVPFAYDSVTMTYTSGNLTGVVYKVGLATVATLTIGYTGNDITSVTRT
jgi:hypothetical protein